ncbi:hypothetical protein HPB52_025709 [Rhipicephalus sanguineus]|uniref:CCHC-type domain-containing protein n=1 Tax=Rhipicephalus sanguineus TaxID=34632 RepID=A0A9D4P9J8_RHISA|nr:hypothetical protein HPB52_025709 [Rhipicephalus sanguineus]
MGRPTTYSSMLGDCLPRWILYHGVYIRLYPFYPRVEACFNCRKVGHRTDVCPHPKRNRCSRCGQDHPPTHRPLQLVLVAPPCSPNSSQGSSPSSSTPGPKKLAWAQGPPESLKASPTSSPDAQAIADTNSSLNALKSYTEATNTSLNTLKNYTEATTAEINAASSAASVRPRSANLPRCRRAPNPERLNHGASYTDRVAVELQGRPNILAITIETRLSKKPKPTARITEWPKFRKLREERASDTITDINEWITSLQEHVQATTREVETTADLHTTDSRLLHMWDAHAGLLRRWRRQRHNKKLRRRLETLAREIENHSLALAQQQWGQLCDGLNGQMSSKRTWHLLRQLLDPCSSKLSAQKQLQRLLHRYPGTDAELLDELALRYVSLASPDAPPEKLPPYSGKPNPQLDEDITEAEIYAPC